LTYRYCHLIVSKLKFHEQNPVFAGNLTLSKENNIQCLFNDNWNLYLQLCIELFDYMEELLNLVQVIFTSLDQSRSNSMTIAGQCRLNPLIISIQDSSLLYDYIVKLLFKLHESNDRNLNETLQDYRQRLIDQFRRLKRFYGQSSTLQYFKNLIKVPDLPEV
jgi:huntingtin interacting protein 1